MPLQRVSQGFKDVSMSFQANPLNGDLIGLKNENAIARALRNIVFTLPGEKFFNENFGSQITASLFENVDDLSAISIRDEIEQAIINYEPRVDLQKVEVFPNLDDNAFDVIITYIIVGANVPPQELQFVLVPTR